jgi:hypothetical protein
VKFSCHEAIARQSCLAFGMTLAHVRGLYACTDALTNTRRGALGAGGDGGAGAGTETPADGADRAGVWAGVGRLTRGGDDAGP